MCKTKMARVVRHTAFMSSASRQLLLRATSWRPEVPEKACLIVAHHYGDHSGKLEQYAGVLASSGIAVVSADYQGWGESESFVQFMEDKPSRQSNYYIKSEEQLVADFDKLVTRVMQFYTVKGADIRYSLQKMLKDKINPWDPEPPIASKVPIFVLGHGMGAPVVARYMADRVEPDRAKAEAVRGCILAAPWIGHCPKLSRASGNPILEEIMCRYFPDARTLTDEPEPSDMFDDVQEVVTWEKDPIIAKVPIPHGTCRVLSRISKQAQEIVPRIQHPTLVMCGGADTLCPSSVGQEVLARLGTPEEEKEFVEIPDSKHDLFKSSTITGTMAVQYLGHWLMEKRRGFDPAEDPMQSYDDARRNEILARYA
eukprot:TRINITY_DN7018_c0_g3_i1.p1 TRINITY_DN7018_c0_g3~~TRINITY_DN7018_c0_g3_i1.p1  ORF type:complete len:369 (+),score=43.78 TRINITY_DN7018_c0_g3_i1:55-1161(+)